MKLGWLALESTAPGAQEARKVLGKTIVRVLAEETDAYASGLALEVVEEDDLPITPRGEAGFVTAAVVDPFGNVLGIMYNPHYLEVLGSTGKA
jgi:hypothetical protein